MLQGIEAVEACWVNITAEHPLTADESTMLMQAMGQLVDDYAHPAEIMQDLPANLKILFKELAKAYLGGYELPERYTLSPAQKEALRRRARQQWSQDPSEAQTYIVD